MQADALDLIRRDIAAFADPATPVEVSERGAVWRQRRRPMQATFLRAPGTDWPDIQIDGRRFGYAEFFASEHMADLKALAENIVASIEVPSAYVEGSARRAEDGTERPSESLVRQYCKTDLPYLRTQVVFLRGPAGAGKTALLRHLSVDQAMAFREGRETFLYLYVDAQGRALSRLDEAIAAVLNDLRGFTYHAVPVLTRLGLIVPVIDGFDELLGIGGYQEAFSSLASFLARLEGRGALVASARASFYALSDLERAAAAVPSSRAQALNYEIVPVELGDWGDRELGLFLQRSERLSSLGAATPDQGVQRVKERVGEAGAPLLRTPFFVSAIATLLEGGKAVPAAHRILRSLVQMFIEREVGKLQDKHGAPILSADQHMRLLELVADEMWWQGVRELDADTISTVAELACEEFAVSIESARALLSRVPAHAILAVQGPANKLIFQHEYYYGFFLGRRLSSALLRDEAPAEFLGRSLISPVVADETIFSLDSDADRARAVVARLGSLRHSPLTRDVVRSNTGLLYAAAIREHGPDFVGMHFSEGFFDACDLHQTQLSQVVFRRCEMRRVDLRAARWQNIELHGSLLMLPVVDPLTTRLELSNVRVPEDVHGVVRVSNGTETPLYNPSDVRELLRQLGATLLASPQPESDTVGLSEDARAVAALLHRFLRMAGRIYAYSNDDLEIRGISRQREWPTLEKLLRTHDLIQEHRVARRGPTGTMMRLTIPASELEQAESQVSGSTRAAAFWRELRAS